MREKFSEHYVTTTPLHLISSMLLPKVISEKQNMTNLFVVPACLTQSHPFLLPLHGSPLCYTW